MYGKLAHKRSYLPVRTDVMSVYSHIFAYDRPDFCDKHDPIYLGGNIWSVRCQLKCAVCLVCDNTVHCQTCFTRSSVWECFATYYLYAIHILSLICDRSRPNRTNALSCSLVEMAFRRGHKAGDSNAKHDQQCKDPKWKKRSYHVTCLLKSLETFFRPYQTHRAHAQAAF